jgi:hypothetical protein
MNAQTVQTKAMDWSTNPPTGWGEVFIQCDNDDLGLAAQMLVVEERVGFKVLPFPTQRIKTEEVGALPYVGTKSELFSKYQVSTNSELALAMLANSFNENWEARKCG